MSTLTIQMSDSLVKQLQTCATGEGIISGSRVRLRRLPITEG
jgi:hypothetical protein